MRDLYVAFQFNRINPSSIQLALIIHVHLRSAFYLSLSIYLLYSFSLSLQQYTQQLMAKDPFSSKRTKGTRRARGDKLKDPRTIDPPQYEPGK